MKKQQKKKNPFKVDHVRSIKLKAKAKQFTGNLKQLKLAVAKKVVSTNEQLSALDEVVRQAPKKEVVKPEVPKKTQEERQSVIEEYNKSQKAEADTLDKLSNWSC